MEALIQSQRVAARRCLRGCCELSVVTYQQRIKPAAEGDQRV